ncbi:MAG: endonuclease domain-containing protein [Devosia sp.]|nr:endonuclease domain-containing protein [Devosia sp.]
MSTEFARKLRRNPPEPERHMWAILHSLRRQGYHFRRQAPIGSYYADFACRHPALVIEVDGETHATNLAQGNDATRDDYFVGRGYRVLRFWNNEVMENAEGVFTVIAAALAEISQRTAPPTLDPSPQRGRESTASPGADPAVASLPLRGDQGWGAPHAHTDEKTP